MYLCHQQGRSLRVYNQGHNITTSVFIQDHSAASANVEWTEWDEGRANGPGQCVMIEEKMEKNAGVSETHCHQLNVEGEQIRERRLFQS